MNSLKKKHYYLIIIFISKPNFNYCANLMKSKSICIHIQKNNIYNFLETNNNNPYIKSENISLYATRSCLLYLYIIFFTGLIIKILINFHNYGL